MNRTKLIAVVCTIQCLLFAAIVWCSSAQAQGGAANYRSSLADQAAQQGRSLGGPSDPSAFVNTLLSPQVAPNGNAQNPATTPHRDGTYGSLLNVPGGGVGVAAPGPQTAATIQIKGAQDAVVQGAKSMQEHVFGNSPPPMLTGPVAAAIFGEAGQQAAALAGRPQQNAEGGKSAADGAATEGADVAGQIGHEMAETAISYTSSYLSNFTVEGGNKWNQIRDNIFVPMGILLLLPGAALSQVRAIMAAGNPVLGQVNPFDGILRSIVAIFMIPGTYLVVNYGIDLANSITHTIADEYTRMFGSDMYMDAICHEIKAMPYRLPEENRQTVDIPVSSMGIILLGNYTPFAQLEADLIAVKIFDPCAGIYIVPPDRSNETVPAAVMAARLMANSSNASLTTSWAILCAFQLAYLYYLWCVGPVVAGLWVWPMKHLRDALPNWVEGVVTLCFWALFWNTIVLLIACFRGVDETGTIIMLALNTMANLTVKFAFDFAGLVRAAGGEAMKLGEKMASAVEKASKGGGGGGGGGGGV